MPVSYNTVAGNLTIGGVGLFCPAWKVENLLELWLPADQRGDDRTRPNTTGSYAVRRYATATEHTLRLLVVGDVDRTGASTASLLVGLYTNVAYLRDNVVAPTGATDGTRSAVLTIPGGSTITEPIHVTSLKFREYREDGAWARMDLRISIPSGRFQ